MSRFSGKVSKAIKTSDEKKNFRFINFPEGYKSFDPMECKPEGKDIWTVKLDFLPYTVTNPYHLDKNENDGTAVVGSEWWRSPILVHNNINNNRELCLKGSGKPCPICDYQKRELDSGTAWDDVKSLNPSKRDVFIVIPIENEFYEEKPYIWEMSRHNFAKYLSAELSENQDYEIFPDLEEGLTLKIRFSAKEMKLAQGKTIIYPETSRIDFKKREKQYSWDFISKIPKLDDILQYKPYKDLEATFLQMDNVEHEETPQETKEEVGGDRKKKVLTPEKKVVVPDKKEDNTSKCPYGYRFGVDWMEKPECQDCALDGDCEEVS
jgi:hypothetical protein